MPPSEEAASLIHALAVELAWFCRKEKTGTTYGHLGIAWFSMCEFVADPRMPRDCSEHCARVRSVLQLAAERLGCTVEELQQGHRPKRKRRAVQTTFPT
jgi:hypothetical protein